MLYPCSSRPSRASTRSTGARWRRGSFDSGTTSSVTAGAIGIWRARERGGCCGTNASVCRRHAVLPRQDDLPADPIDFRRAMDLGAVIQSYGGPLLFVWAWLQGEAAVIVGGSLAAQGYWPWWAVWLVACVPATLGHQIYYALGRWFGESLLDRLPDRMQPAIARARTLVRENAVHVMLMMRFACRCQSCAARWASRRCASCATTH